MYKKMKDLVAFPPSDWPGDDSETADFYLTPTGYPHTFQEKVKRMEGSFNIKVTATNLLVPKFLYYYLLNEFRKGTFLKANLTPETFGEIMMTFDENKSKG